MNARVLVLFAAVAAVWGCATTQPGGPPPKQPRNLPCQEAVCFVEVTVVPGANCSDPNTVLVTPDPIRIARANPNPTITIQWDLDDAAEGAGYTFDPDKGIALAPNTQFSCRRQGPPTGPKSWMCQDKNDDAKAYKYAVNLKKGGTACAPKDPYIVNGY